MKKVVLLFAALMLVSGIASANSIFLFCTPFGGTLTYSAAGQTQTSSTSCPGITLPAGDTLVSVEVYYLADYQFGQTTNNTVNTTETAGVGTNVGSWGVPNSADPYTCVTTGGGSSNVGPCTYNGTIGPQGQYSTFSGTIPTLSFQPFTVAISATEMGGSFVSNSSYGNIVEYDYTIPAPEPASLIMSGAGLLGVGLLLGKRRKKA